MFESAGGGAAGLVAILNKGLTSADPKAFFRGFGEYGNQIELLARTMNGPKGLLNALEQVKNEGYVVGSVFREFTNKNSTNMAKLRKEWARFQAMMIDFGAELMPILSDFLAYMRPIILDTTTWIKENKQLTSDIAKSAVGLIAFSTAMAGISFAFSGLFTLIAAGAKVWAFFAVGGGGYAIVTWATALGESLAYAAYTGGLITAAGVVIAGSVAAIGLAFYGAYKYIEPFRHAVIKTFEQILAFANHLPDLLKATISLDWKKAGNIRKAINLETKINTDRALFNDIKEHQPSRILDRRAGRREDRGQEVSPQQSYQGPLPTAQKDWMSAPAQSIQFSPILNFNTPLGPDAKAAVAGAMRESQYEFEKRLKETQRREERRKL